MPVEDNHINIELRSEDVQDILNHPPNWMISWGNTILILMVLGVFILSYFIKYPDVIEGRAILSTTTPPVYVSTRVSGRIHKIHIRNGELVSSGQVIAEMDNPVPVASIGYLRSFLEKANTFLLDSVPQNFAKFQQVDLYDAANDFLNLKNTLAGYEVFLFDKNHFQKLAALRSGLSQHEKLREITIKEAELSRMDIENARQRFQMQEDEYKLGLTSKLDFLNAQTAYNQSLKSEEAIKKSLIQTELTLEDYRSQIQDFSINRMDKAKEYRSKIETAISTLQNYIIRWETDFTIRAPVAGKLDYQGRVKVDQLIDLGTELFAIVPLGKEYEVEVKIPTAGFGRVKIGQEVKLKLDKFPSDEYGTVGAVVSKLPVLADGEVYTIGVSLEKGLLTQYGVLLEYSPEMTSSAQVITEDLRLIERFFSSLKDILKD